PADPRRRRQGEAMHHPGGPRPRRRVAELPGSGQLTGTSKRELRVGLTAASVGLLYGYDLSCIAGALLFITEQFGLTTEQQELLTTMAVLGRVGGGVC